MSFHLKTQHAGLALSGLALISLAACREENRHPAAAEPLFVPAAGAPQPYEIDVAPAPASYSGRAAYDGRSTGGYGYAERAYELDRTFYESAPDYGFVYDGVEPWVWESDDWLMYVEPLAVGYRYYYYEPGADYPYFVRDPDYAYGYDHGRLTTIYDGYGRLLPATYLRVRADRADRYRDRAHALRAAAASRRIAVAEDRWRKQRPGVAAGQSRWIQAAERQPDWKRYRATHDRGDEARIEARRERRANRPERQDRPERQNRQEWGQADHRRPTIASDAPPPIRAVRRDDQRRAEHARPERQAAARIERRDGPERTRRQALREAPGAQAQARPERVERADRQVQRAERANQGDPRPREEMRQVRREERAVRQVQQQPPAPPPVRQARAERPDHQVQRVERANRDAAQPRQEMRQVRREARAAPQVQQQAPAAPPVRQARAERQPAAAGQANHAAQAGRDASARADHGGRGHGKPDKD